MNAGAIQLGPVGGPYIVGNYLVTSQHENTISALSSFAESATTPANTAITYQLVLNGVIVWWDSSVSKWVVSDGTFAKSNSAAVVSAHVAALFTDLALLVPQFMQIRIYLTTTSTGATPVLTSNTIGYTWVNGNPTTISVCTVYGYLSDLLAGGALPSATQPISLLVSCDHAFFHSSHFVLPFTKSASFDITGYVQIPVIETATPGVPLNFSITYYDGLSIANVKLFNAIIPLQPTISLDSLTSVQPYNFG